MHPISLESPIFTMHPFTYRLNNKNKQLPSSEKVLAIALSILIGMVSFVVGGVISFFYISKILRDRKINELTSQTNNIAFSQKLNPHLNPKKEWTIDLDRAEQNQESSNEIREATELALSQKKEKINPQDLKPKILADTKESKIHISKKEQLRSEIVFDDLLKTFYGLTNLDNSIVNQDERKFYFDMILTHPNLQDYLKIETERETFFNQCQVIGYELLDLDKYQILHTLYFNFANDKNLTYFFNSSCDLISLNRHFMLSLKKEHLDRLNQLESFNLEKFLTDFSDHQKAIPQFFEIILKCYAMRTDDKIWDFTDLSYLNATALLEAVIAAKIWKKLDSTQIEPLNLYLSELLAIFPYETRSVSWSLSIQYLLSHLELIEKNQKREVIRTMCQSINTLRYPCISLVLNTKNSDLIQPFLEEILSINAISKEPKPGFISIVECLSNKEQVKHLLRAISSLSKGEQDFYFNEIKSQPKKINLQGSLSSTKSIYKKINDSTWQEAFQECGLKDILLT